MPTRYEQIISGNTYHFYNRGVNKGPIFFSHRNYQYFLYKLGHYFNQKASIYAFCLMPNHFHLLARIEIDDFTRLAIQPLLGAYSKAVNQDQGRVGPLFQGRYQAKVIGNDEQLLDCVRYIHMNPVEAGLVRSPAEWDYSSYQNYLESAKSAYVDTSYVMQFFDTISDFIEFSEGGGIRSYVFGDHD